MKMSYEQVFPECPAMINDGKLWEDKNTPKIINKKKPQPNKKNPNSTNNNKNQSNLFVIHFLKSLNE